MIYFIALLSALVVGITTYVLLKWRRVKNFWSDRGVPHYAPHFIVGSLTFLLRNNPAVWMRQLYHDFNSPYVGMWAFWRPGLVINCPELAKKVLVKDQEIFRNRFLGSGKTDPIGGLNLFTVNDPTWSYLRRRLSVIFTSARLRNLNGLVKSKADDLVLRIKKDMGSDQDVDLRNMFTDYTTDVIGEAAFGLRSESVRTGDSAMRKVTRDFVKFNVYRALCWSSIFFYPEMVDVFRFSLFPKDTLEFLKSVVNKVIKQRGGYEKEIKESKDLLDALLKIKQEAAADNEDIDEDLLLAQAAIFVQGGFDTSATALTWILYELAWNPECQEKLYQEVLAVKQKIGDQNVDYSGFADLTYMGCVIKEVLRKYPPMGWLDRITSEDYAIDENLTIPKGTVIYVNAVAMQVDPKLFPDPYAFNPDRFLPENEKNIKPYTFLPFGEGPRGCIGKRFAYQTINYALESIILNYEIRVLPNTPKPCECPFENKGLFLAPKNKLSVEFRLRH